jgi:prepilin-type N-terminal cleavage/methylation domain-containing protein
MRRIRAAMNAGRDDSGMSLIEVIVALMVFAVITLGVGFSLVTMTRIAYDSHNRESATNLAAAEIDLVNSIDNPFDVLSDSTTKTVGGLTYTIDRSVAWISTSGAEASCGSTSGNLQFKRVNVSVTWPGMLINDRPVRADTVLAPITRINDPSNGTIIVHVIGADGTGRAGVTVTTNPALTSTIPPTDADGCSYIMKVPPATYTVSVSKSNFIDVNQLASPSKSLDVTAGATFSASYQYDERATFNLTHAPGNPAGARLPNAATNWTTYFSTYGIYQVVDRTASIALHPFTDGYSVVAGKYEAPAGTSLGCQSPDPASWVETATLNAGVRGTPIAVAPGGSATLTVPMGKISLKIQSDTYDVIQAWSTTGAASTTDPGCTEDFMKYTFSKSSWGGGDTVTLALPYGSWKIYSAKSTDIATPTKVAFAGPITVLTGGSAAGSVVTLDPRTAK